MLYCMLLNYYFEIYFIHLLDIYCHFIKLKVVLRGSSHFNGNVSYNITKFENVQYFLFWWHFLRWERRKDCNFLQTRNMFRNQCRPPTICYFCQMNCIYLEVFAFLFIFDVRDTKIITIVSEQWNPKRRWSDQVSP